MTTLPTRNECLQLLEEHNVPENVRKHSLAVNKVAVFLADKLRQNGIDIDIELVDRASLLHDIDKIPTLGNGEHGEMARQILSEKGHKTVGDVIRKHVFRAIEDPGLDTWEEKVVNYADKRCTEDKLVSLDERFSYAREMYADEVDDDTERIEAMYYGLENEIFGVIGLDPDRLGEYLGVERADEEE